MSKLVTNDNLKAYHAELAEHIKLLQRNTTYVLDDIVNYDGKTLKCTTAGTTANTKPSVSALDVGNTLSDGTVVWTRVDPDKRGIDYWASFTIYALNNQVIYDDKIYKCSTAHTSTSTFDTTKWTEISASITHIDDWVASTAYVQGDLVAHSAKIYRCITSHTSESTWNSTEEGNWEELSPMPVATTSMLGGVKSSNDVGKVVVLSDGTMLVNGGGGGIVDSAAAHNAIYRGGDLTTYFDSGDMLEAIADGSFRNIYPGDYIIKSVTIDGTTYSDVKWIVMDLDTHLYKGNINTTAHHVVIMPEEQLGTVQMNTERTSTGGYLGSAMWTTHIPKVVAGVETAFGGAHILQHFELLSNAMDANLKSSGYNSWSGASSGSIWASVKVNLANENMVYGAPVFSSSAYDIGECSSQLAAFRLNPGLICSARNWWWLRSVASSSAFCAVDAAGGAGSAPAAYSNDVRPYFLLC